MADIVSKTKRSEMMAGIRGKNTGPERLIRQALFAKGFRFKLHDKSLPGKPDLVLPKYNAVIQINGCFWHGHNCPLFHWPKTRPEFWRNKITGNQLRDQKNHAQLTAMNWRVLTLWECALKGRGRLPLDILIEIIANWLDVDKSTSFEITGTFKC